jgi:polyisoprenyl-phosphate glycosyltransferase
VQMVRRGNPDAGFGARLTTAIYSRVIRRLTDVPLIDGAGDFRLVDAKVAAMLLKFSDSRPFYRGMVSWLGYPVVSLEFDAKARPWGRSKLGLKRRMYLSFDGITSLSIKPLRMAAMLGASAMVLSLLYALVVLVSWFMGRSVAGYPTIIFSVVFLGAVQLITLGVLGEYLGRVFEQSRRLPPYVVADEED